VPVRANIYALKALGVRRIISVSAVGSMREELAPLDLVIPDQIFDRTRCRVNSFFGEGVVAHVGFADPFCRDLSAALALSAEQLGVRTHRGGTYLCIEGPQFSTKAESRIYRSSGRRRDRHDRCAGSKTGARSRTLLRHPRLCNRLRRLARPALKWSPWKW